MILGNSKDIDPIILETKKKQNQFNDLKLTYHCDKQWQIESSVLPTEYTDQQERLLMTNNKTCELIRPYDQLNATEKVIFDEMNKTRVE